MIKLAYIGGLGLMSAPAAVHLSKGEEARVIKVHDRGSGGGERESFRRDWREHGAELVSSYEALFADESPDGVVVCVGKNADDLPIIVDAVKRLANSSANEPFVLHLSTVSSGFVEAAALFAVRHAVQYVNYPLTGGPQGARFGGDHPQGMLILAAGTESLYHRLEPILKRLGRPRYFGARPAAGAEVKLIGQHLVFNGCVGASSAVALHSACFSGEAIGGEEQTQFFDFLNGGAGGTRQWELALRKGVAENNWSSGFAVQHAVVDALYAADLAREKQLARPTIQSLLNTALTFSFLLNKYPDESLPTHAIVRELVGADAQRLDEFFAENGAFESDLQKAFEAVEGSLPENVRRSVKLDISPADFT